MAKIVGGLGTAHVPAIGAAVDLGKTQELYWKPLFGGYVPAQEWLAGVDPDVIVLVYNDHATAFSLEIIPTFAIGVAEAFPPADEGWGPRPVPVVEGHSEFAWHLSEQLIHDDKLECCPASDRCWIYGQWIISYANEHKVRWSEKEHKRGRLAAKSKRSPATKSVDFRMA